jgi:hypothetical protein
MAGAKQPDSSRVAELERRVAALERIVLALNGLEHFVPDLPHVNYDFQVGRGFFETRPAKEKEAESDVA